MSEQTSPSPMPDNEPSQQTTSYQMRDETMPTQTAGSQPGSEGIGTAPAQTIATLPPIEVTHPGVDISSRTGEPRRTGLVVALQCLFYGAAGALGLGYLLYWWRAMHIENFVNSAWIVSWLNPRPGSAGSVVLVIALAVLIVLMVGAPSLAAYNTWCGRRSARAYAIAATILSCCGALFNPLALVGVPLCLAGLVIVLTKPVRHYFDQWQQFRTPPAKPDTSDKPVFYGRLPRFS